VVPGTIVVSPGDCEDVRERVQTSEEIGNFVVQWTEGRLSFGRREVRRNKPKTIMGPVFCSERF